MNYREFCARADRLMSRKFSGTDVDSFRFAVERAEFEEKKLRELITLASGIEIKTIVDKRKAWERMLARVAAKKKRFKSLYFDNGMPAAQPAKTQFDKSKRSMQTSGMGATRAKS